MYERMNLKELVDEKVIDAKFWMNKWMKEIEKYDFAAEQKSVIMRYEQPHHSFSTYNDLKCTWLAYSS